MTDFKCGDFFIVRLRNYADAKLLKTWEVKYDSEPLPDQHYERAKLHNTFFWDFVKKITGKDILYYHTEYSWDSRDCAKDEIQETHGIHIHNGEGWVTYYIPKKHVELFEWFKMSATVPMKIVKRTNISFLSWRSPVSKLRREESKKRTLEFFKKP